MQCNQTHLVRNWVITLHYSLSSPHASRCALTMIEKIPRTDLCNRLPIRASADRSIPERAAFAERVARCPDSTQDRNATPNDLAVVRPRVDTRLTPRSNFGQITHDATHSRESRAPHRAMLPCRGVINRVRGCVIWPLTLPILFRKCGHPHSAKH
jgi:hypothetical protein